MNKTIPAFLLIISFMFFSCKKEDDTPQLDKEVRLNFPMDNYITWKPQFELLPSHYHLVKFNKANYPHLKSITFFASLATSDNSSIAEVELFNVTDSVSINNTLLQASTLQLNYKLVQSVNIFDELPDKEIDLGVRLKSQDETYVYVWKPFLLLER